MKTLKQTKNNLINILSVLVLISNSLVACESTSSSSNIDIHTAVATANIDDVKAYIKAGDDLNVKEPFGGSSPLISAALYGRYEIAKLLIESGAAINQVNNDGSTALHVAAFFCRTEIVELLVQKSADQNIVNKYGATALASISGPYKDLAPTYEMMKQQLAPIGVQIDLARIEKTRPQVAELLNSNQ